MTTALTAPYTVTPPATLAAEAFAIAQGLAPGITSLPANLIGDMNATSAGSLSVAQQALVDLVNSVSPYTANAPILYQLGNVYGVQQGIGSNTSVYVTFSGTPGFVVNIGFTVSDGTYQYTVQDGGIVESGGVSAPLYCLATSAGSWAVPVGSVTQLITSVPSGVTLSCNNTTAGLPGASAQSLQAYQAQVIQAGLATGQGMATYLKTQLQNVSGVQSNLIAVQQVTTPTTGWKIIVGGGDPYAVAQAIYTGLFNILDLVGSNAFIGTGSISGTTMTISAVTAGTITLGCPITGTGVSANTIVTAFVSGTGGIGTYTVSVSQSVSSETLSSGGSAEIIAIQDFPDTYTIIFVVPLQQRVNVAIDWTTVAGTNFVSNTVVSAAVQPAMVNYINSLFVGQPISILEMQQVFQTATATIIPQANINKLTFAVQINGVNAPPDANGILIHGSSEGYFYTTTANITVTNS